MARLSMILSTGLLVVWVAVLGSGGSLLDGWKSGPKAVSPQVFGLLLWSRITMFQRQQQKKHVGLLDGSNPLQLNLVSMEAALLPRPVAAMSWPYQYDDNSFQIGLQLKRPAPVTSFGGALCQNNNSSNVCVCSTASSGCTEMPAFRSKVGSSSLIFRSQSKRSSSARTTEATRTTTGSRQRNPSLPTSVVHAKPAQQLLAKPMSMLLHGSASRTPTTTTTTTTTTASSTDLPQETSRSNRTHQTKHLQFYDDTTSLGAVVNACKRTHMSNNYETTALCHATPLYSATRQLEDRSLVLSQDPNSVTSMIAISTVLIFATFVTF